MSGVQLDIFGGALAAPPSFELRDYQRSAVDSTLSWLRYKETPSIVSIPTGGGKTAIIRGLCESFHKGGLRTLVVAHRKELLEQAGRILSVPFGFYSAGIGEKRLDMPVTVAGIQSIARADCPPFDRILIDECHRVSNEREGQYWSLIDRHPKAKVVGLTATPFRMRGGALTWGEVVYSIGYPELLKAGYIAPLSSKPKHVPDLSRVPVTMGDFSEAELEEVMTDRDLLVKSVQHVMAYGESRRSVLIFCVSVRHCHLLAALMEQNGLDARVISGETPDAEREAIIEDFKAGKLKHLLNCEVLLEGFDHPALDMIVCLRPTKSKGLWEQLIGRGVRKHPGKENCLLIDMAGNLHEHGGLGAPVAKAAGKGVKQPTGKICPVCESFVAPLTKECPDCKYQWPEPEKRKVTHQESADHDTDAVYVGGFETYKVTGFACRPHKSKKGNESIRVDYYCDYRYGKISEWLSVHHESDWVRGKARAFLKEHGWAGEGDTSDYTMDELLWQCESLKSPTSITVDHSGEFPRVVRREFQPEADAPPPPPILGEDDIPFDW